MAVVGFAQERPDSPQASFSLGKQTVTRKFLVKTSSKNDGPIEVLLALGLPRLFQPYAFGSEFHPYCRCRSLVPARIRPGSMDWEVTCTYSTPAIKDGSKGEGGGEEGEGGGEEGEGGDGGGTGEETDGQFENPELAIPELEMSFETIREAIWGQFDDENNFKPIQASSGEIFVPPPQETKSLLVITITRNESIYAGHPALGIQYQDSLNSDTFWGAAPLQCKCKSITAKRQLKQWPDGTAHPFLRVTYVFQFRDTWVKQLLDKGNYYWEVKSQIDPTKVKKYFKSIEGQPIEGLLDGSGGKLPEGGIPVYVAVKPSKTRAFSALNLPQSFADVQ